MHGHPAGALGHGDVDAAGGHGAADPRRTDLEREDAEAALERRGGEIYSGEAHRVKLSFHRFFEQDHAHPVQPEQFDHFVPFARDQVAVGRRRRDAGLERPDKPRLRVQLFGRIAHDGGAAHRARNLFRAKPAQRVWFAFAGRHAFEQHGRARRKRFLEAVRVKRGAAQRGGLRRGQFQRRPHHVIVRPGARAEAFQAVRFHEQRRAVLRRRVAGGVAGRGGHHRQRLSCGGAAFDVEAGHMA